ncbi:hypothetical protein I7I53_12237 [Histoplasma capsulatum var. duboisii H88]|uniref:Uncharacterized protein n=1 Tax=Ajellomyces capsulatus (strain H88) TaxID=544711 RepID=A0A8A1M142_AJEC8|nr:hypothetical protein I7I53_12237 [Histoplasma capsulatum var. duboisii H88]
MEEARRGNKGGGRERGRMYILYIYIYLKNIDRYVWKERYIISINERRHDNQ